MVQLPRKPKYRFLDPGELDDIPAEPVPLDGVFQLTKPRFEPLASGEVPRLDDGEGPTAVGQAVMEWWGEANDQDWRECPTDLVRAIEAVSATNDNIDRIRQAMKNTRHWERNHAGIFSAATIDVLIPAIGPATVQPRDNMAYGRRLRQEFQQSLIHEVGEDLVITGEDAGHFDHIRTVQQQVIEPRAYRGGRMDFVDSLALEGVREPLRGFVYRLSTRNGQAGSFVETDDGFTRVAVAQHVISNLLGGLPTDLSRLPWNNGDGTLQVRGWTVDKIVELHDALDFAAAPFQVWPDSQTTAGVSRWIRDSSREAQAVMRLMTARMIIGIKVKPHRRHSTHDVVYADMARFHVKGHQPDPWSRNDDEAFKARTIVSNLTGDGFIEAGERDVMLGVVDVPWRDDPSRVPYRNRVVATVDTMARLVVEDPRDPERYPTVRRILKAMQVPNSPTQAASAAASLAVEVAGLVGSGEVGGFTAMLRRTFANAQVRHIADHKGDWTTPFTDGLDLIAERARADLDTVLGTSDHASYLSPNMRALAMLAMVAHGMNPKLTEYRRNDGQHSDGTLRTVRWPSSMTTSGRGGRAGATAADAHTVVFHMARSPKGINQLEAIVRAVTDYEEPIVPVDPLTGEELLEDTLRVCWSKNPDQHGEPRTDAPAKQSDPVHAEPEGGNDTSSIPPLSDAGNWNREISTFRDELRAMASKAAVLEQVPAGPEQLDIDPDEWDPDDATLRRMLDVIGIEDATANAYDDDVDKIRKFFSNGVLAWFRHRASS